MLLQQQEGSAFMPLLLLKPASHCQSRACLGKGGMGVV